MRIWEALLMGVIPIGDASSLADRMLQAEGYPLVLVDDWALISEARLATCTGCHLVWPPTPAEVMAEFHSDNCYTQVHHGNGQQQASQGSCVRPVNPDASGKLTFVFSSLHVHHSPSPVMPPHSLACSPQIIPV